MHQTLIAIQSQLEKVIAQIPAVIPSEEPFANAHGNWTFPGLTRSELIDEAQAIVDLIRDGGTDDLGSYETRLQDYVRRIQYLSQNTLPNLWGNPQQGVPAYLFTLGGLRKALEPTLKGNLQTEAAIKLRKLSTQIRSLEARLNGLQPRTVSLSRMVERIENAHNAADQLPTDLESLQEARVAVENLVSEATKDQVRILDIRTQADTLDKELQNSAKEAGLVLKRCETAYSAATSVGLAAAFSERSKSLSTSMWFWIAGLITALAAGSYFGSGRLRELSTLFNVPNAPASLIAVNLFLSLLSIGAPVWFAWLATKQIGQRFRLAEDYAFKASISQAYEGFRREAARFDKEMESKLLTSALSRLDELPLRLVETATHGSPWHELASSDTVKQALRLVPGFAEQVNSLASKAIERVKLPISKSKAPPAQDAE